MTDIVIDASVTLSWCFPDEQTPMLINNQFVQVAPPIMVTLGLAAWLNNKTVDGIGKRIDDLNKLIDASIRDPSDRIARLEERSSPLARR